MEIILDNREHALIASIQNSSHLEDIKIDIQQLPLGDIIIRENGDDIIIIERKTYNDLLSSIKDSRFSEQSYRLSNTSGLNTHSIIYVIEGNINSITDPIEKKMVYSSMSTLLYYKGFSVMRTGNVSETGEFILNIAEKIRKETIKKTVPYTYIKQPIVQDISNNELTALDYCKVVKKTKKENVVKGNVGQIMLSQIPGISSDTAIAILKGFDSFTEFIYKIKENPEFLNDITTECKGKKRKISKNTINKLKEYLS